MEVECGYSFKNRLKLFSMRDGLMVERIGLHAQVKSFASPLKIENLELEFGGATMCVEFSPHLVLL